MLSGSEELGQRIRESEIRGEKVRRAIEEANKHRLSDPDKPNP